MGLAPVLIALPLPGEFLLGAVVLIGTTGVASMIRRLAHRHPGRSPFAWSLNNTAYEVLLKPDGSDQPGE